MKATMESTDRVVTVGQLVGRDLRGEELARVWEGVTEAGVRFTAYVAIVQVRAEADQAAFTRDLQEHKVPDAETIKAIDLRLVT